MPWSSSGTKNGMQYHGEELLSEVAVANDIFLGLKNFIPFFSSFAQKILDSSLFILASFSTAITSNRLLSNPVPAPFNRIPIL